MSRQKPLNSDDILLLGKCLRSSIGFSSLIIELTHFIEVHFKRQCYVLLNQSYAISPNPQKNVQPPFNYDDFPNKDFTGDFLQTEINNQPWLITKLNYSNEALGFLLILNDNPLNELLKKRLLAISELASIHLYAKLQAQIQERRHKQLALVRSVSEKISQATDLDDLSHQITELVQSTFGYYYVAIFLLNPEISRLQFKSSASADKSDPPDFERSNHPGFALGEHLIGYVADTGQEIIANDISQEPRYKEVNSLNNTKSEAVIPLKAEDRILGVFDVQSNEMNAFNDNDLLILRSLANIISMAVESASLYQRVQSRAEQLATVSEVSRAIIVVLDTDDLLTRIVNIIHDRFVFPFVHLYTYDPQHKMLIFKAGSGSRTPLYQNASASFDIHSEIGILSWVARNKQTKRINNVSEEPLFRESPYSKGSVGSEMAIPIFFGSDLLGVLDIQSDHIFAFSADDQQLLETLAHNIAIAMHNARLYRSEKWRRQVAERMRDVAGLLSENIGLQDLLNSLLEKLQSLLPCDIAGLWMFEDFAGIDQNNSTPKEMYLAAYKTANGIPSIINGTLTTPLDSWVSNAINNREPTIRYPGNPIGPIGKAFQFNEDYSSISAPLMIRDETLGMITLVHHEPGRYGSESQKITAVFANYAAIAIKNNRLYTASQEQAWISTILLQVAQATQSQKDLNELVETIVRLTPMVTGVKGCALFLREPESGLFSLHAFYGIGESNEELELDEPLILRNAPLLDQLVELRNPLYVQDPKMDLNLPEAFSSQMEKDTLILMPLISRDQVLGAFMLANEPEPEIQSVRNHTFSEERLKIIQGIIQQTTVAIENIRLLEAKQEEAYVSTVLLQSAQAVVSSADLQDTLDSIVNIMPILVGIETSIIYFWNPDEELFRITHASTKDKTVESELMGVSYRLGDFPILDAVFSNNRSVVFPFIDSVLPADDWDLIVPDEGQIEPLSLIQSPYPLLICLPLAMKDDVFGVLIAKDMNSSMNRERRFELINGMAQQASLAIQNDLINREILERDRLDREFQLAREIQQTFLPSTALDLIGWEMDVRWETARQVGGDFYDYFLLPDGRLAVVIADVSDKGLAASLYMAVTRTLIRAAAQELQSPARTLERVNTLLLDNSQNGLFVTVFFGILAPENGRMVYTIAGHNPPMLQIFKTKKVLTLDKGGIAIGALPDIHLPQSELVLNDGDCLILYTDGVTEAFNGNDDMYGTRRLKNLLTKSFGKSAHSVVKDLETDLNIFRGNTPLSDDTTILAICKCLSLTDDHREDRGS